jgi:hypothetical protein
MCIEQDAMPAHDFGHLVEAAERGPAATNDAKFRREFASPESLKKREAPESGTAPKQASVSD